MEPSSYATLNTVSSAGMAPRSGSDTRNPRAAGEACQAVSSSLPSRRMSSPFRRWAWTVGFSADRPFAESGKAGPSSVVENPGKAATGPKAIAIAIGTQARMVRGAADGISDLLDTARKPGSRGGFAARRPVRPRPGWRAHYGSLAAKVSTAEPMVSLERDSVRIQTTSRHRIPWGIMAPRAAHNPGALNRDRSLDR